MHLPRLRSIAMATTCAAALTAGAVSPALTAGAVSPAITPAAAATPTFYYKASWGPTIYRVIAGAVTPLTYAQWSAAGKPAPLAADVLYTKVSWDATIYRSTFFVPPGNDPDNLHLDIKAYQSDHHETLTEWVAAGRPAPENIGVDSISVDKWETSDELFATTPNLLVHKLDATTWEEVHSKFPTVHDNQGFLKLTWSRDIAFSSDLTSGTGKPISYAQWTAAGLPTPREAQRFPGDQFTRRQGSSTITYTGPTMNRPISYAEWLAAGSPAPAVR